MNAQQILFNAGVFSFLIKNYLTRLGPVSGFLFDDPSQAMEAWKALVSHGIICTVVTVPNEGVEIWVPQ